jgi:AcrR family transcriptional regulator
LMKKASHNSSNQPRPKRSLTPKGQKTRQALLNSARAVFEEDGYFGASISEIGRRCNASQGTFYQYFRNKEQIFRELIDAALFDFWNKASKVDQQNNTFQLSFRSALAVLLEHCHDYAALHRVLNEFELIETVTISYYDSIARYFRGFFREAVRQGQTKQLDPNLIAYSLLGLAMFLQMKWAVEPGKYTSSQLSEYTVDLICKGISGDKKWQKPKDVVVPVAMERHRGQLHWEEIDESKKGTRKAIFQAAEQVFGEYGYSRAGIADITRRAGVAQGTFYVHFKSKEELMDGVVRFLSRELRRELRRVTDKYQDRRDKEISGMLAFLGFLGKHSPIYRIVSESEAIEPESAEYYYGKLASGYNASLAQGIKDKEIKPFPLDYLVAALMGINHMIGLRWLVWNSAADPEIPRQVIVDTIELIIYGIRI